MSRPQSLLPNIILFARSLRGLGFPIGSSRIALLVEGFEHLSLFSRDDVKAGARTLLVTRREQIPLFDIAFDLFFRAESPSQPLESLDN
jgi:uncharacterized protein with von Willebrand factor type A (vWA) domain